jgi:deoxynogalonate / 12-deoxyaklanonic acid monooxygenase
LLSAVSGSPSVTRSRQKSDGTEVTRGTVLDWAPPRRVVITWRIGANWRPVADDEQASRIRAEFRPAGQDSTEVVLTYTELDRHGDFAVQLRAAIEAGDPGESLQNYADLAAQAAASR